jgi:predicted dehydrogenase
MDKPLGVGVVGLHEGRSLLVALNGTVPRIAGTYPVDIYRTDMARAVAGCDLREEKIAEAKQVCPDLFYTTSYEEMLKREDVDIAAIYTPDHLHGQQIEMAFEAGKQVICTKPLINSVEDARRILQAARRTGGKLLVGQSTRFFESFRRQRQAYEGGEVGQLEFVDAHYIHRMDWYYDKSPWVIDQTDWIYLGMSHPIDLIRWYMGPIEEVQAMGSHSSLARRYGVKSFDIYSANFRSVDGRIGRAMGNYGIHELPSARNSVELMLYGSDGSSMAQYHDMNYYYTKPDGTEVKEDMLYHWRGYHFNNETHGMHYGEFANYTDYFVRALVENQDYSPNLEEGVETFCIMEATRQSSREGKPVLVTPLLEEIGLGS